MKLLISFLLVLFAGAASAKTCTATLNGTLKYRTFNFPLTKVYYPDDSGVPSLLLSSAASLTSRPPLVNSVPPACYRPRSRPMPGRGLIIAAVLASLPLKRGDSSDYPYPATFFEGTDDILIDEPAPASVKDTCDVPKLPLTTIVRENVLIQPDPLTAKYSQPSEWGSYTWDPYSSPAWNLMRPGSTSPPGTLRANTTAQAFLFPLKEAKLKTQAARKRCSFRSLRVATASAGAGRTEGKR
ncbi:MAG: hypothetical protein NDI69_05545 [Bacteriovoracaceae bacterium]|nr:hypothetical protein [Bacteriovoracaceae bacterium]